MAIRAIAAAVTLVAGIGFAASADARCGGKVPGGQVDVWQSVLHQGVIVWVPVRYWPDVAPIVLSGDEALAEYRRNAGLGGGPVDANGMPRRRC